MLGDGDVPIIGGEDRSRLRSTSSSRAHRRSRPCLTRMKPRSRRPPRTLPRRSRRRSTTCSRTATSIRATGVTATTRRSSRPSPRRGRDRGGASRPSRWVPPRATTFATSTPARQALLPGAVRPGRSRGDRRRHGRLPATAERKDGTYLAIVGEGFFLRQIDRWTITAFDVKRDDPETGPRRPRHRRPHRMSVVPSAAGSRSWSPSWWPGWPGRPWGDRAGETSVRRAAVPARGGPRRVRSGPGRQQAHLRVGHRLGCASRSGGREPAGGRDPRRGHQPRRAPGDDRRDPARRLRGHPGPGAEQDQRGAVLQAPSSS